MERAVNPLPNLYLLMFYQRYNWQLLPRISLSQVVHLVGQCETTPAVVTDK